VVAGVGEDRRGLWITWDLHRRGAGIWPGYKLTEKPVSGAGTETEQGVLQPGSERGAGRHAPGGFDSSCTWTVGWAWT